MTIRIDFSKRNESKYISHLDLQRAFMRLLRRTDIPIWLTQGFNPHPYLNFCSPLSVGMESEHELLDLKIAEQMDFETIKDQLNQNMPRGLCVNDVYESINKFQDVCFASYDIYIDDDVERFRSFWEQRSIMIMKKTKKSEIMIDLKNECRSLDISHQNGIIKLKAIITNNQNLNINPNLLINAFKSHINVEDIDYNIVRLNFLNNDLSIFN